MRIDSGLDGYQYSSRLRWLGRDSEEKQAPEEGARRVVASDPASSSTLLSASLSGALWSVEGARAGDDGARQSAPGSELERVQDAYREYS